MKKILLFAMLIVLTLNMAFAGFNPEYSDYQYYIKHEYQVDWDYLVEALKSPADDQEKAAILWRMARTRLTITDSIPDDSSHKECNTKLQNVSRAPNLPISHLPFFIKHSLFHSFNHPQVSIPSLLFAKLQSR